MKSFQINIQSKSIKYLKFFLTVTVILYIATKITSTFWNPIYGTSDDWIIDSWLNSNKTGTYEKESVFISGIFSNLISYLYLQEFGFAWYSIVLVSVCSFSLVHWFVNSTLDKSLNKFKTAYFINISILILLFLWNYFSVTFTATAIIAASVGIYSLMKSVTSAELKKFNFIVGNFLLMFAYVIRPESLIGATAVFATTILIIFLANKNEVRPLVNKIAITIILLGSVITVNKSIENNQSLEMKQFRSWVMKVQKFADRPRMIEVANNLDEASWSSNQYHLFTDMLYFDKNIINENWIDRGLTATNNYYLSPQIDYDRICKIFSKYYDNTKIMLLIFLFSMLFYIRTYWELFNFKQKYSLVFSLITFAGIHIFVGLFMHNVARVTIPLLFTLFLAISTNWWKTDIKVEKSNVKINYILFSFVVISLTFSTYQLSLYNSNNNKKIVIANQTTKIIKENFGNRLILYPGRQEFDVFRNPYIYVGKDPVANSIMFGNWDTFSPQWNKRVEKLGIDSKNISKSLLIDNRVLWATQDFPQATIHLLNFFKEGNYGDFQFNLISDLPNGAKLRYLSSLEK
jgi:hypothetical protein